MVGLTGRDRRWVWWLGPLAAAALVVFVQAGATSASAPGQRILAEEQAVVDLVNAERRKVSRPALIVNYSLQEAAWSHNEHMVRTGCFAHNGCGNGDPASRIRATGYQATVTGENIAQSHRTPEEVVNGSVCSAENQDFCFTPCTAGRCNGWMQSSGHRSNILNNKFTDIGVAYNPSGPTWTQVFAAPQPDYRTVTPPRVPPPTPTPKPCVLPEDVTGDKVVDRADVDAVSDHFLATPRSPDWDPRYDVVANGMIDLYDVFGVVRAMGQTCP